MKVWSTRDALKRGVLEVEAEDVGCGVMCPEGFANFSLHGEGREWEYTEERARKKLADTRRKEVVRLGMSSETSTPLLPMDTEVQEFLKVCWVSKATSEVLEIEVQSVEQAKMTLISLVEFTHYLFKAGVGDFCAPHNGSLKCYRNGAWGEWTDTKGLAIQESMNEDSRAQSRTVYVSN